MIRSSFIAAAVLACATAGHAQAPGLDTDRARALDRPPTETRQRVADVAGQRNDLPQLDTLQPARQALAPPPTDPLDAPLAATAADRAFAALADQQAQDAERIMQLRGEALARSNARILAVQPAL